jgi:hypothetical protein
MIVDRYVVKKNPHGREFNLGVAYFTIPEGPGIPESISKYIASVFKNSEVIKKDGKRTAHKLQLDGEEHPYVLYVDSAVYMGQIVVLGLGEKVDDVIDTMFRIPGLTPMEHPEETYEQVAEAVFRKMSERCGGTA